ncbi:hypothetical protein [Halalkalibacter urbisdiaboli]|uniref:hypothetical protein n=1 Tax=Halalkalibacter urbisdiaboli TaxID=1960589 RepID=UPI000B441CF5|nr:hypothetical protein [Halalkalibacter urbisdiaboli]
MTLVLTAGLGSAFSIMTSDERILYRFGRISIPTKQEGEKVFKITESVLLGWGADFDLAEQIRLKVTDRVKPDSFLEDCKQALEDVIDELRPKRHKSAILMSGFYSNGSSGMILYNGGEVKELKQAPSEYRYALLPPTADYTAKQNDYFYLPEFFEQEAYDACFSGLDYGGFLQTAIQLIVNKLVMIHATISYLQKREVSPTGYYYVIYKDATGQLQTLTGEYDTGTIQEQLTQ